MKVIDVLVNNFSEFNWYVWYLIFSVALIAAAMVDWYLSNIQLKKEEKEYFIFDIEFFLVGII